MTLTPRLSLATSLCLIAVACGTPPATTDGASTDLDSTGAASSSTGAEPTTGADDPTTSTGPGSSTDLEPTTDAGSTTSAEECPPQTAIFGADGGELALCGATLRVPAGAVAEDIMFGIEVVTPPADPPFEYEFASPVFHFTPTGTFFTKPVELTLPRPVTTDRIALGRHDPALDRFGIIEACEVTDTTISQSVYELGTFAALRGTYAYPDSTAGLGGGALELELLGATATFPLDFGIYADREDGGRNVSLKALRELDGGLESLRVELGIDSDGAATLVSVEWISTITSEGYTYIDGLIGSNGAVTLSVAEDDHYVGELSATAHGGNPPHDEPLHATFDVTVEKYTFPPELSCPGMDG